MSHQICDFSSVMLPLSSDFAQGHVPCLITLGPLKIVHQRPASVSTDIDAILADGLGHCVDVVIKVLHAEVVLKNLLEGHVVLALERRTVLGDVDLGVAVALAEPVQEVTETLWVWSKPEGLGLGTDALALFGVKESLQVPEEIVLWWGASLVLDVVGRVMVHAVEVVRALHQSTLLLGEGGETIAELLEHGVGVFAKVDGISKPADGELNLAVAGLNISRVLGVPRKGSVTVQGDADLATMDGLEVVPVSLHCTTVGDQQVVADGPGLASTVADGRFGAIRSVAGGEVAAVVAKNGRAPGLVEGDPVLALGNGLEHNTSIILEIERKLGPVQKTTVALVQRIRKIPVVKGDERGNASLKEVINELDVVVNALLVDRIVATTERNDS